MSGQKNERDPTLCGWSIGFDSVYVCRLGLLPCNRITACPLSVLKEADGGKQEAPET